MTDVTRDRIQSLVVLAVIVILTLLAVGSCDLSGEDPYGYPTGPDPVPISADWLP